MLRAMAKMMTDLGVRPEIEAFDTGHLWFAKQLVEEGLIEDPVLVQLCMGIPWGAPDDLNTFMAMVNNVPPNWTFSAFSIGRNAMAYPAAAVLAGGNVRVGLEDNLYIGKGQLGHQCPARRKGRASVVEGMGARIIGPEEVREKLKLDEALMEDKCTWSRRASTPISTSGLHRRRRDRRRLDRRAFCSPASMSRCSIRIRKPSASSAKSSPMPSAPMAMLTDAPLPPTRQAHLRASHRGSRRRR